MLMTKEWVKDKNKPEIAKNIYTLISQLHMPISTPRHVKKIISLMSEALEVRLENLWQ